VLKAEIKKERVPHYPFHLVTAAYSADPDYFFLIAVDYALESTVLAIYPFDKEMNKLTMTGITINSILSKKAVSTLHIVSMRYKPTSTGVVVTHAEFVLGHRSGQVAVI
jgi:hypothetical protein